MNSYKVLNKQIFSAGDFSIVPIRFEDRLDIMTWRNEQIYHLRQTKPLTEDDQNNYFNNVVSKLFVQDQPSQLLFSFLNNDLCIGYGGLVHINWIDRHAEISFIMNSKLERDYFQIHWSKFLYLIEQIAFDELKIHKVFTYAFNIRPHLYNVLEDNGFKHEATLNEHCLFQDRMIDVYIHSKLNSRVNLVEANESHTLLTHKWANDPEIRNYSFNQDFIPFEEHKSWFLGKINDKNCSYFIFQIGCQAIGSVRLDINPNHAEGTISYLIDPNETGKGYGTKLLQSLEMQLKKDHKKDEILLTGLVKIQNIASIRIFEKLNYVGFEVNPDLLKFQKKVVL